MVNNTFLRTVHERIMDSMPELEQNTGLLTTNIEVDRYTDGILYRFKPEYGMENKYIVILAISSGATLSDVLTGIIYRLRDQIGINGNRLIIIHSNGKSKRENEIDDFLSENADLFHPDYIRLSCTGIGTRIKISLNGERPVGLATMLKKYYTGKITFIAPVAGKQFVNLEIYRDTCCECKQEINIVSGIVFPTAQLPRWDNPYWKYYNTLIPVYSLPGEYPRQIKRTVNKLREKNMNITPLVFYQDIETEENDWTVMCPHCRNVINKYEPEDHRMGYFFDLDNRRNGNLQYHTILIDANQELINLLDASSEAVPCVCYGGWVELKNIQS